MKITRAMGPRQRYAANWAALVLLAVASFVLSKRPLAPWSFPLAMAIAASKALLIVLFFMHVARYRVSARLAATAAVGLIALLAALMVADVATRAGAPRSPPPGAEASR
jgi:cytochrome c oxidase subunit 4